jgi:uncharacterized membrane protein
MSRSTDAVTFFIREEIVESTFPQNCFKLFSLLMDMNTNNLGLSTMATGQMNRMIDDAAWLTYPLHLVVGLLKTLVYTALFISFVVLCFFAWMFTAHDERAELTRTLPASSPSTASAS